MKFGPTALYHDIRDRPLRYIGPLHLAASAVGTTAFGISGNPYLLSASAVAFTNNIAFTFGGDGGDHCKRTLRQIKRAEKFELSSQIATLVGGSLYMASSVRDSIEFIHPLGFAALMASAVLIGLAGISETPYLVMFRPNNSIRRVVPIAENTDGSDGAQKKKQFTPNLKRAAQVTTLLGAAALTASYSTVDGGVIYPSELAIGSLGIGGAAIGMKSNWQCQPGSPWVAIGKLCQLQFKNAAEQIGRLQPYQKSSLCWTVANAFLVPVYLNTNNPLVLVMLGLNLAANRLIYVSQKADPNRPNSQQKISDVKVGL